MFFYRNTKFFYLSGAILGVLALLVFVLLTLKRFIPRVNLHLQNKIIIIIIKEVKSLRPDSDLALFLWPGNSPEMGIGVK